MISPNHYLVLREYHFFIYVHLFQEHNYGVKQGLHVLGSVRCGLVCGYPSTGRRPLMVTGYGFIRRQFWPTLRYISPFVWTEWRKPQILVGNVSRPNTVDAQIGYRCKNYRYFCSILSTSTTTRIIREMRRSKSESQFYTHTHTHTHTHDIYTVYVYIYVCIYIYIYIFKNMHVL